MTSPKMSNIVVGGITYEYLPKQGAYIKSGLSYDKLSASDKRDKSKYISRRQFAKFEGKELAGQGFTSFEEKAKFRKQFNIPKNAKARVTSQGYTFYSISFKTEKELKEYLKEFPNNRPAFVTAKIRVFGYSDDKGKKGMIMYHGVTPYATKSILKKRSFEGRINQKFGEYGAIVEKYELRFTTAQQK